MGCRVTRSQGWHLRRWAEAALFVQGLFGHLGRGRRLRWCRRRRQGLVVNRMAPGSQLATGHGQLRRAYLGQAMQAGRGPLLTRSSLFLCLR